MTVSNDTNPALRSVCILGHNPLSTALLNCLSKTSLHIHLIHSSAHALDLPPPLITFRISHHQHPNSTFTNREILKTVFSSLSPPADLVISTGHGGDYALQTVLIAACIDAKIPRFIPAEFGHDSLNPTIQDLLPPHAERAKVVDFLKAKEDRIEWVGLATGCDVSRRLVDGNIGVDLAWQSATVFGTGEERFAASTPLFVGRVVRAIISNWQDFKNQYLCVSEVMTSYREILAALEKEMSCRFEVGYLEKDEGINEANRRLERGWPDAGMFLLERSILADGECFKSFDDEIKTKLGVESQSIGSIVHEAVHEFNHNGKGGCGCG